MIYITVAAVFLFSFISSFAAWLMRGQNISDVGIAFYQRSDLALIGGNSLYILLCLGWLLVIRAYHRPAFLVGSYLASAWFLLHFTLLRYILNA